MKERRKQVITLRHALGYAFPHEGFVQAALERHFSGQGFQLIAGGYADLVCIHPESGERWIIEAKGKTSGIGLDLRTGLGQLVTRMEESGVYYGLAVPQVKVFVDHLRKISPWVRQALNLHWVLVADNGVIRVCAPDEAIDSAVQG